MTYLLVNSTSNDVFYTESAHIKFDASELNGTVIEQFLRWNNQIIKSYLIYFIWQNYGPPIFEQDISPAYKASRDWFLCNNFLCYFSKVFFYR